MLPWIVVVSIMFWYGWGLAMPIAGLLIVHLIFGLAMVLMPSIANLFDLNFTPMSEEEKFHSIGL